MVKVREHKLPQHNISTTKYLTPKKAYLPLIQHIGKPARQIVQPEEEVEDGQLIAEADGLVSSHIHSPIKGKISAISDFNHPLLQRSKAVVIEAKEEQKDNFSVSQEKGDYSREDILRLVKEAGIVGMGGAAFPTHVKLNPPKKIDTLIINGCECEPYLTCDYRLMIENTHGIFKGIELIARVLKPKNIYFAVENNKPQALKKINSFISTKKYNLSRMQLKVLKSAYPQGAEKQLIYSVTKRKVPAGGLPFDAGCMVNNVATCFAIYEAVYFKKPLIERIVSFCGDALDKPKNIWVKVGTTVKELFDSGVLSFKQEPKKVIFGGPMMGIAVKNLDYPILKGTSGVLFLSQEADSSSEAQCIRCSRCVDSCPMGLLPLEFVKLVKQERFKDLDNFYLKDCIECGSCSFVCPAKIPLVHYIKIGKTYAAGN